MLCGFWLGQAWALGFIIGVICVCCACRKSCHVSASWQVCVERLVWAACCVLLSLCGVVGVGCDFVPGCAGCVDSVFEDVLFSGDCCGFGPCDVGVHACLNAATVVNCLTVVGCLAGRLLANMHSFAAYERVLLHWMFPLVWHDCLCAGVWHGPGVGGWVFEHWLACLCFAGIGARACSCP